MHGPALYFITPNLHSSHIGSGDGGGSDGDVGFYSLPLCGLYSSISKILKILSPPFLPEKILRDPGYQ